RGSREGAFQPARSRVEGRNAARAASGGELADPVRRRRRLRETAGAEAVRGLVARVEVAERVGGQPDLLRQLRPAGRLGSPAGQAVEGQARALPRPPLWV